MKHLLLLSVATLLFSCSDKIDTTVDLNPVDTVINDPIIVESLDSLGGIYDVFYIKGDVAGVLTNYKKHEYSFDFTDETVRVNSSNLSFNHTLSDSICTIEFDEDFQTDFWFERFKILEYGDTMIINPLNYGTHLTIKFALKVD